MGFPNRSSRNGFGPTYEQERPPTNPKTEIGSAVYNLAFWQLAGCNLVVPAAIVFVDASGSGGTTIDQRLAWDPNALLPLLTWVRSGVGIYTFAFASTYEDENGADVSLKLRAGAAWNTEENGASSAAKVRMTSDVAGEVRVYKANGSLEDHDFAATFY